MKKRLLALILVAALFTGSCFSVLAADTGIGIIDNPLQSYFENQLLGVQKGTGVTLVCPNGDYSTLYTGGTLVSCPYDGEALVLAGADGVQAKKYQTGGGSAGTGGVGRHPSGYTDTAGTPSISSAGVYTFTLDPIIEVLDKEHCSVTVTGNRVRIEDFDEDYIKSNTVRPIRVYYTATSPADGKFSVPYTPSQKVYDYY